jgi:hypothetical protein
MLENGVISEKDYDRLKKYTKEVALINKGYAFVTFSHSVRLFFSVITYVIG